MNKFDLPAFFERDYYESRFLNHMNNGRTEMAKIWEEFYFTNALAYAWVKVFDANKSVDSKKAMVMADNAKKELEKSFKC